MKNYIFFCLLLAMLSLGACEKNERELIGTWQLVEVLADPGDGSGVFTPVDSDRIIQFNDDGSYTANGDLCDFSSATSAFSVGRYDLAGGTISPADCATIGGQAIGLSVNDEELIISYPCIEPCQHKYARQ